MKKCAKCRSENIVKFGKTRNQKARYYCKDCKYCFTRKQLEYGLNNRQRLVKMCVKLHLENVFNRGIARLLKINHQTVANYLKQEAKKLKKPDEKALYAPIVEIDEMWSFLKDKDLQLLAVDLDSLR